MRAIRRDNDRHLNLHSQSYPYANIWTGTNTKPTTTNSTSKEQMTRAEKEREYQRQWWLAHPGYRRSRYLANKERLLELDRIWKENNREICRAYCRRYYHRDSARQVNRVTAWIKLNPEKHRANKANSNAKRRLKIKPSKDIRVTSLYKRCQELRQWFDVVVDHIMPLSCGGLHEFENLQIIYAFENNKKHTNINYKPRIIFI